MKKVLYHLWVLSVCFFISLSAKASVPRQALPDSVRLAELDQSLVQSLDKLVGSKSFDRQFQEVKDFLSFITDSSTRQHLALKCYDYYIHSPLNGAEAVAIMMVDSLFSPRKIQMHNEVDLMNARIYAEFNRQTLLGKVAPVLTLYDPSGNPVVCPMDASDTLMTEKYSVVYFYSADCPKCKIETAFLRKMLQEDNPPIRFYAVYTDDDFEKWQRYVAEDFNLHLTEEGKNDELASRVEMIHLWDPEYASDFRQLYGVLQTPKMFFLNKENVILGRSLDTYALKLMMHGIEELHPYVYGSEEADKSFEELFKNFQPELTIADIRFFLSYTEKMFPKDNPGFKHTVGDLMFYLCRNRYKGSAYLQGADYVVDHFVRERPQWWTTETDTLQVLSFADYVKDLSSLLPLGTLVPEIRCKGELRTVESKGKLVRKVSPEGGFVARKRWNLRKMKLPVYVVMYTEDCSNCQNTLSIINDLMATARPGEEGVEKMNFLLVDVGKIEKSHPRRFHKMLEKFDLSFMPFIFELDENGIVQDKYIYL